MVTVVAVHRDHAGLFRHVGELEHDVVERIGAELVLARVEEVQARDGEPPVVGEQNLLALGVKRVERRHVVGALGGSNGGDERQQEAGRFVSWAEFYQRRVPYRSSPSVTSAPAHALSNEALASAAAAFFWPSSAR